MSEFSGKKLFITGGTGSFGNAVLKRFIDEDLKRFASLVVMRKNKMICVINLKIQK